MPHLPLRIGCGRFGESEWTVTDSTAPQTGAEDNTAEHHAGEHSTDDRHAGERNATTYPESTRHHGLGPVRTRRAMRHDPTVPFADRAQPDILDVAGSSLSAELAQVVGAENVFTSATDLIRFSADASPYRLVPSAVVRPRHLSDVVGLIDYAHRTGRGLTMRGGGSSLNGQSQTEDILVDMREHFRWVEVLDDGKRLRGAPGVVLARANGHLLRHGRMLGPDPASSGAATLGGVIANNASGMTSGVVHTANKTLDSLVVVLASGTVIDTAADDADERFARTEPQLYAELVAIRDELRADHALAERIAQKFAIKNTSAYRLDAFLEHDRPIDILMGVMVGSEGTFGVVVDSVWKTVPLGMRRTTGFLRFRDVRSAAAVVAGLNEAHAQAVELMDTASLRSLRGMPGIPEWVRDLPDDAADAVILTERRAEDDAALEEFEQQVEQIVGATVLRDADAPLMTRNREQAAVYWRMRSGLLATIGAARPAGTSLITEDVVVPPARLPDAVGDLQQLLVDNNFTGAVNGHASAGNLHFYLYLDATTPEKIADYRTFMSQLVDLITTTYDGSLKGEHGTGRNMAPFIEQEWGPHVMHYLRRLKSAFDPENLLGRGIFLNPDLDAAFSNLKSMPEVHPHLDPCIECGFCEPVCPSRHLTTTPRQRIVLQREIARQGHTGPVADRLVDEYAYDAVETCAGDSSCAIACPVDIDTGAAMKELRREGMGSAAEAIGSAVAKQWGPAERITRSALRAAAAAKMFLGDGGLAAITGVARKVGGEDLIPQWVPEIPHAAGRLPQTRREGAEAVFFSACINRIFGPPAGAPDRTGVAEALVALAERAGHPVWIPEDISGLCCATVWHSKGLQDGNEAMAGRILDALWRWSDEARLPVVVDASSCTLGVSEEILPYLDAEQVERHAKLRILDAMTFTREVVLPDLVLSDPVDDLAVIHPTCSMRTLGIDPDLRVLAGAVAAEVFEPVTATCCAFAGDRGMLHPELTRTATLEEAEEIEERLAALPETPADRHVAFVSGNRTCELGMEHATGEPYESVIVALERATRATERVDRTATAESP